MRGDRFGAMGFFEDYTAMVVVVITITIFLATAVPMMYTYIQRNDQYHMEDEASEFLDIIRSSSLLILDDREGVVDMTLVNTIVPDDLIVTYNTDFDFIITIRDVSSYNVENRTVLRAGTGNPEGNVYCCSSPVALWYESTEVHSGILEVCIW